LFLNAILWRLGTGTPWRDLPPEFDLWKSVINRFCRWRDLGVFAKLLAIVADAPDLESLMFNATHIKAHPHSADAKGRTNSSLVKRVG